jgi:hypothetical protein
MKKLITIFLIAICSYISLYGQKQYAITEKGKTVILSSNGTWKQTDTISDTILYNQKMLLGGCWFVPHDAMRNIKFYENYTFKMHLTNMELVTGSYKILGHDIKLTFNNNPVATYLFIDNKTYSGSPNDALKSYPIDKAEYWFVHSDNWVHPNLE